MLKTSRSIESTTQPGEGVVGVGSNSRARHDKNKLDKSKLDGSGISHNEVDDKGDNEVRKKGRNLSKSKNLSKFKKTELGFLIFGARMAFTQLRQAFIKAPILYYFNPKYYIWVETDVSNYAIGKVFS